MNTGGRIVFESGSKVRYLTIDGKVSSDVYVIHSEDHANARSDRRGLITLKHETNSKLLQVHARRILPLSIGGKSPVICSNDKYRVICQTCGFISDFIDRPHDDMIYCVCGSHIYLHWTNEKPISKRKSPQELTMTENTESVSSEDSPKVARAVKQEVPKINLDELAGRPNCELWTRCNIRFDHVGIDVKAHILLHTEGLTARKLCFNTYDGTLGKRSKGLSLFDDEKQWFLVSNPEKARTKFVKDGYVLHRPQ